MIRSKQNRSARALILALIGAALVAAPVSLLADLESQELRLALSAARSKMDSLEARLAEEEKKNENLGAALAAANAESIEFRDAYARLRERMEGLGLTALDPSPEALQARLLAALSDLRHVEAKNRELSDQIVGVHEAVLHFVDTAVGTSDESRDRLDLALRKATSSIGLSAADNQSSAGDLHEARVISMKKDLDLLVLNVGKRGGARIGMPFRIVRKDRPIGSALLVDVRDAISGAVLQSLVSDAESVKVGDIAQIDPTNSL